MLCVSVLGATHKCWNCCSLASMLDHHHLLHLMTSKYKINMSVLGIPTSKSLSMCSFVTLFEGATGNCKLLDTTATKLLFLFFNFHNLTHDNTLVRVNDSCHLLPQQQWTWHRIMQNAQLDFFHSLKDVSPPIRKASSVLTNWRGVLNSFKLFVGVSLQSH